MARLMRSFAPKTRVAATAVVMLLGLPVAYLMATRSFPGKRLIEAMLELPMVLPPTVAGVGLLLAFGRRGLADAVEIDGVERVAREDGRRRAHDGHDREDRDRDEREPVPREPEPDVGRDRHS